MIHMNPVIFKPGNDYTAEDFMFHLMVKYVEGLERRIHDLEQEITDLEANLATHPKVTVDDLIVQFRREDLEAAREELAMATKAQKKVNDDAFRAEWGDELADILA